MGLRKKKKVVEKVEEEKKVEVPVEEIPEEDKETGDIGSVEEVKEEKKVEPVKTDIRVGNKVIITIPRDYEGRRIEVDPFSFYTVYAIEGDKVQLRSQGGRILFVKLSGIKKIS